MPKEPFHVEARIQPVDVHLPQQDVRVTASGIPDKIKLEWDGRQTPLDVKWPSDPLMVNVNLSGNAATNNSPCCCKDGSTPAGPREVSDPSNEKRLRDKIDALQREIDKRSRAEKEIRDETSRLRMELDAKRDARQISESEHLKSVKDLDSKTDEQLDKVADDFRSTIFWEAVRAFGFFAFFGALGGFAVAMIEFLRGRRKLKEELNAVEAEMEAKRIEVTKHQEPGGAPLTNEQQRAVDRWLAEKSYEEVQKRRYRLIAFLEERRWIPSYPEWFPRVCIGIVAALMVPIGLLFIPGVKVETASADPYILVTLWSMCFVAAMIGEPFIEFVLRGLRNLTTEKETPVKTVPSH